MNIHLLKNRGDFGRWLNSEGLLGEGAEVGCCYGANSAEIMKAWKGAKLYMVDLWAKQDSAIYKQDQSCFDHKACKEACEKMAEKDARIKLIQGDSVATAKQFKDGQLDWAYIDANHCLEAVMADCIAWWPKVKSGGVLGGHDCYNATIPPHYCQVLGAMVHWCLNTLHLPFQVTDCSSWWIVKP